MNDTNRIKNWTKTPARRSADFNQDEQSFQITPIRHYEVDTKTIQDNSEFSASKVGDGDQRYVTTPCLQLFTTELLYVTCTQLCTHNFLSS